MTTGEADNARNKLWQREIMAEVEGEMQRGKEQESKEERAVLRWDGSELSGWKACLVVLGGLEEGFGGLWGDSSMCGQCVVDVDGSSLQPLMGLLR